MPRVLLPTMLPFQRGACQEPLLAKIRKKEQLFSVERVGLQAETGKGSHSGSGSSERLSSSSERMQNKHS